jgi:hypothetical protein
MSPEWLTAIGTLGTFVVIAASAVAALMQLRHMRGSNQIVALNEARETLESPYFQEAQRFVRDELPLKLADQAERKKLVTLGSLPAEYAQVRNLANFFEHEGVLVKHGIIDPDIACNLWRGVIQRNWKAIEPIVTNFRVKRPALWENFEYLAMLSKRFDDAHPEGAYPVGAERMPQSGIWAENVGTQEPDVS